MAILVTGGAGYIGCHVAHALKQQGEKVIIYDNLSRGYSSLVADLELVKADISDSKILSEVLKRVDSVIHFAAYTYVGESISDPRKYFQSNISGGLAFLDTVINSGIKNIIFSSSCAVYGIPLQPLLTEDHTRLPINPYGFSKLAFEYALESYGKAYGLNYVIFRYFNAAGADESGKIGEMHTPETHLIPLVISATNKSPLLIFGSDYKTLDRTCIRDYIHVSDLAEAHILGLEYLRNGGESTAFNLGTGKGYSVKEVISMVEQVTKKEVPYQVVARRPGDPATLVADPHHAKSILNWVSKRSLEQMVQTAYQWHKR